MKYVWVHKSGQPWKLYFHGTGIEVRNAMRIAQYNGYVAIITASATPPMEVQP